MSKDPRYLGDGVCASFDGYHICLLTGSHREEEATNKIALEPSVFSSLAQYWREIDAAASEPEETGGQ